MEKIKFGDKVRCKYSGFEGVVLGKCEYYNGNVSYHIVPKSKDNREPESVWLDESRVEVASE